MSPDFTSSPSFTSHLARVPSSMVGERAGIFSSIDIFVLPRDARHKANAAVRVKPATGRLVPLALAFAF
jgi:hypothetical protein